MKDAFNPLPENTLALGNEKKRWIYWMEQDLAYRYDLADNPSETRWELFYLWVTESSQAGRFILPEFLSIWITYDPENLGVAQMERPLEKWSPTDDRDLISSRR